MIDPTTIIGHAERVYHLKQGTVKGSARSKATSEARSVAMYLTRQLTGMSYPEIGRIFDRHHTTVLKNVEQVNKRYSSEDPHLVSNVKSVINQIRRAT